MDLLTRSELLIYHSIVAYANGTGWNSDNRLVTEPDGMDPNGNAETNSQALSMIAEIAGDGHLLFSIYQFIVAGTVPDGAVSASFALKSVYRQKEPRSISGCTRGTKEPGLRMPKAA